MFVFVKIKVIKYLLFVSELKLVIFMLDLFNVVCDLLLQELVNVVGVSQFSVVKFVQKLGYKGYFVFKLVVIDVFNCEILNMQLYGKIMLNDGFEQMVDKLFSSKISVLNEI